MAFDIATLFQTGSIIFLYKIGFLLLIGLFFIFLLIVLSQIRTMNTVVRQPSLFGFLRICALALLIAVFCLFLIALVIL